MLLQIGEEFVPFVRMLSACLEAPGYLAGVILGTSIWVYWWFSFHSKLTPRILYIYSPPKKANLPLNEGHMSGVEPRLPTTYVLGESNTQVPPEKNNKKRALAGAQVRYAARDAANRLRGSFGALGGGSAAAMLG